MKTISYKGAATAIAVAISLSAIAATGQESDEISEKNWQQHPKIVEIRKIVQMVDARLKNNFKTSQRRLEACEYQQKDGMTSYFHGETRRIARDTNGAIRYYSVQYRPNDYSQDTNRYYFDDVGRLRFAYVLSAEVGGGEIYEETRIYFDKDGRRIWVMKKPATEVPTDDELFKTSASALEQFNSASPCREIKRSEKQPPDSHAAS
jgi:hypothetical protein